MLAVRSMDTTLATAVDPKQPAGFKRTSGLLSPTMLLSGHQGQIYASRFSRSGEFVATCSHDKTILLWNVYNECTNWGVLKGHKAPILEVNWSPDGTHIYSASADKTGAIWDCEEQIRIRRLREHTSFVNCICCSRRDESILATGSDDATVRIWDLKNNRSTQVLQHSFQVTTVVMSDDNRLLFSGGIDNDIKVWDMRARKILFKLDGQEGHKDSITGLALSPDGSFLLSNAMDSTVRVWDIRPFVQQGQSRLLGVYEGIKHDFQKNLLRCSWSPDGSRISAGSADRFVYIWETQTRRLLYKLPGHTGAINDVQFHPIEPIIASAADDKRVFLGELQL